MNRKKKHTCERSLHNLWAVILISSLLLSLIYLFLTYPIDISFNAGFQMGGTWNGGDLAVAKNQTELPVDLNFLIKGGTANLQGNGSYHIRIPLIIYLLENQHLIIGLVNN